MEQTKEKESGPGLLAMFRKDAIYLIVMALLLLLLLLAVMEAKTYENKCNNYYLEEMQRRGCASYGISNFNESFKPFGINIGGVIHADNNSGNES